ncbi:MAG: hypothetical protein RBT69_10535 [Spirochaetia bacterium]|jgi:hypothetical protein|nr:hypothetical protein [Spirochaetia bacterium]
MKNTRIILYIVIALFLTGISSCSSAIEKKLVGKWKVTEAHLPSGQILKNPDMKIVFTKSSFTIYTNGKLNLALDYKVKKDFVGYYIETSSDKKLQGQRLEFADNDSLSLELSDYIGGQPVELKYYLKRIVEK